MGNYFDPEKLTLEDVILRTMGKKKDVLYGDNFKMEDHPSQGYVQVNISSPTSPKGHVSYDIPYDKNGVFGKARKHN